MAGHSPEPQERQDQGAQGTQILALPLSMALFNHAQDGVGISHIITLAALQFLFLFFVTPQREYVVGLARYIAGGVVMPSLTV